MKNKNSREVLNSYPSLYWYPLFFCVVLIALLWNFPYEDMYKFLASDWLSFVPVPIKVIFGFFILYFCIHYTVAIFGAAMIAAAILRIEGRSYSLFDGLVEVFKSLKYVSIWIIFDLIFYPIVNYISSKLNQLPGTLKNAGLIDLAYWKLREFAVPIVIFDRLWPEKALDRATNITLKKGLASLLKDIGWELSFFVLIFSGFLIPFIVKPFLAMRGLENYWFLVMMSYFIFVWVYFVLNKAIRIAQIYSDSQKK